MFGIEKNELLKNLEVLRKSVCCYMSITCDCKYGIKEDKNFSDEKTGCPELRQAMDLIRAMDEKTWNKLVKKSGLIISKAGKD